MVKYKVECMLAGYGAGAKHEYMAANDAAAFELGWEFARKQWKCIAFSVSKRVGRRKVYISPETKIVTMA